MAGTSTQEETNNRLVEAVFRNFQGRREALIKAFTTESLIIFLLGFPGKESLCLFGQPDGTWEVKPPVESVPPAMPEPMVGINFLRAKMPADKWIHAVAIASDSWLLSLAFFLGAATRAHLSKHDRARLFTMINSLPTLCEIVTGDAKGGSGTAKSSSSSSSGRGRQAKGTKRGSPDEAATDSLCAACGTFDAYDFWIGCDTCEKWYHGECVDVTLETSLRIGKYECPPCMAGAKPATR
ncbi:hypothetical protein GQ457_16G002600 [Hibiscus cannabinus]